MACGWGRIRFGHGEKNDPKHNQETTQCHGVSTGRASFFGDCGSETDVDLRSSLRHFVHVKLHEWLGLVEGIEVSGDQPTGAVTGTSDAPSPRFVNRATTMIDKMRCPRLLNRFALHHHALGDEILIRPLHPLFPLLPEYRDSDGITLEKIIRSCRGLPADALAAFHHAVVDAWFAAEFRHRRVNLLGGNIHKEDEITRHLGVAAGGLCTSNKCLDPATVSVDAFLPLRKLHCGAHNDFTAILID